MLGASGKDHPQRDLLHGEVHARPFIALDAPECISHVAMLSGEDGMLADRAHLARLCDRFGVPAPYAADYFYHDFGPFRLKWERHTEFCTYTFLRRAAGAKPFAETAIGSVPGDWLAALPGERLVAIHVALEDSGVRERDMAEIAPLIGSDALVGSGMARGRGLCWTDFHIHNDGFSRFLLQDRGLQQRQAGRLVQRLLDIETYRMMALLAFPIARDAGPRVTRIDRALAELAVTISDIGGPYEERDVLMRLTGLASEAERMVAESSYRFGAATAYAALVAERIGELREEPFEGVQTVAEFMERRLGPAIRTCESVARRLDGLSGRIARLSNLLRTRIDVALEEQNQILLRSMSRRARLQLRLQTMIEGVSVVAASYYVVGLLSYALAPVKRRFPGLDADIALAAAVPAVLLAVWWVIHAARRRLIGNSDTEGG